MSAPQFLDIWADDSDTWARKAFTMNWKQGRRYYRFRSACRMAFWIPLTTVTFIMFLSVMSVYS